LATLIPASPDPSPAGLSTVAIIGLLVLAIAALAAVGAWLLNWYRAQHPDEAEAGEGPPPDEPPGPDGADGPPPDEPPGPASG
jgi:hypothetical protein